MRQQGKGWTGSGNKFERSCSLAQASPGLRQTSLPEQFVELLEGVYHRHRDHIVTAGITDQVFYQALSVCFPGIAKPAVKEVVAPEGNASLLFLGTPSRYGCLHRLGHPVIPYGAGYAAEEIEGLVVPFEKGFLLLVG